MTWAELKESASFANMDNFSSCFKEPHSDGVTEPSADGVGKPHSDGVKEPNSDLKCQVPISRVTLGPKMCGPHIINFAKKPKSSKTHSVENPC